MRDRRRKVQCNDIIKSVALVGTILLVFISLPPVFKIMDCNNAEKNLTFIERCIESENCTLTQREMQRFEGYTRLKLKSCPKD